jgi:hypothetical protein
MAETAKGTDDPVLEEFWQWLSAASEDKFMGKGCEDDRGDDSYLAWLVGQLSSPAGQPSTEPEPAPLQEAGKLFTVPLWAVSPVLTAEVGWRIVGKETVKRKISEYSVDKGWGDQRMTWYHPCVADVAGPFELVFEAGHQRCGSLHVFLRWCILLVLECLLCLASLVYFWGSDILKVWIEKPFINGINRFRVKGLSYGLVQQPNVSLLPA